jgi:hypothetical protein
VLTDQMRAPNEHGRFLRRVRWAYTRDDNDVPFERVNNARANGTGRSRSCFPCAAGTFNPLAGAATCTRCPAGKAAPNAGMTMCLHTGGVAAEGERCAAGFCEDAFNCPKCAQGLKCSTRPGMMA